MAKTKTLLETAKSIGPSVYNKNSYSNEEIELALAWANSEIGLGQVQKAKDIKSSTQTYVFLSRALRQAIRQK